jgi:hypothetical protein
LGEDADGQILEGKCFQFLNLFRVPDGYFMWDEESTIVSETLGLKVSILDQFLEYTSNL